MPTMFQDMEFVHDAARREHAFLLKCEGLTLQKVGERLGVNQSAAAHLVRAFARRFNRAVIHTKISVT